MQVRTYVPFPPFITMLDHEIEIDENGYIREATAMAELIHVGKSYCHPFSLLSVMLTVHLLIRRWQHGWGDNFKVYFETCGVPHGNGFVICGGSVEGGHN